MHHPAWLARRACSHLTFTPGHCGDSHGGRCCATLRKHFDAQLWRTPASWQDWMQREGARGKWGTSWVARSQPPTHEIHESFAACNRQALSFLPLDTGICSLVGNSLDHATQETQAWIGFGEPHTNHWPRRQRERSASSVGESKHGLEGERCRQKQAFVAVTAQ